MSQPPSIDEMFGSAAGDTFLGLPKCADFDALPLETSAVVLGAPLVTPYQSVGSYCHNAPAAIRRAIAPYAANLHHVDFDLGRPLFPRQRVNAVDCGDLPYHQSDFAANRGALQSTVESILDQHAAPIVLGGDDSVPIPLLGAFAGRGDFVVVQVDAHIDWRDEVNGERYGLSSNMRRASEMSHVGRIVQIGQRAIGSARPTDYQDALDWGVQFHSGRAVADLGISPALADVPPNADVILAIDVDGLDPSVVPGVIGRAPGGLNYWQVASLIHGIAAKARLRAVSLVEFMPERDVDDLGALTCARLVANTLGVLADQKNC